MQNLLLVSAMSLVLGALEQIGRSPWLTILMGANASRIPLGNHNVVIITWN